ncbi:hypothetical protein [Paractinoplanes rishiriensis]|uniref:Uncharacterized protein n=1 Tax=Paractinoplanes rishiriensis TaxID=1050105 RepID=A0A919K186_9ACTN|nr:hypothetical protein [Actinoplanes rishiriensis]GIE98775.1 hypothetical protein Ari01nite_62400 [Actinoplanes rishiriensis]
MTGDAEHHVWARMPEGTRAAMAGLPGTQLQTLLLAVARDRAERVRPPELLRRWRADRLVRPSAADPRVLAAVESRLWHLLPATFDGVELSPVTPLGTCAAVAPGSQNRIVTTMRTAEVVSDSTNALAVEAADRRSRQPATGEVHLAAAHRLLRAQRFGPGMGAHFRLFSLVSSARATGGADTETKLLRHHLDYWQRVLTGVPGGRVRFTLFDRPALRAATTGAVEEPDRDRGRGYYRDLALRLTGADTELGDGGFTDWTAQLLGNAKERCLTSCISVERLATLAPGWHRVRD